jgi:ABC-type multidrug transport system fused ATPase/permease subunit
MKSDYQYLVNTKQGANLFLTITAPGQLGVLFNLIPRIITEVLLFVVIMFFLLSLSFYLTVIIFIIGVLFHYLTKIISQKVSYITGIGRIEASQVQNITANEAFNGIRQIMVFNARNYWLKKFEKATNAFFNYVVKDSLFANMPSRVLYILSMSVICFGAILGKKMLGESLIGYIPLIGVYYLAFQRIIPSMSNLGNYRLQYMKGIPFAEKVYNVLKQKSNFISDGSLVFDTFKKDIRFVDVSFSHQGREKTLKNLSLTFNKNDFTAIVGPSGAGKSTIVDLIVRLFECQNGKILIDGIDLKDIKLSTWLDKIGFVSQDTFIYNATIYDNITFGLRNVSKEDVYNSARLANAHDFILELPDGYEAEVGDRGLKLSGGQRQRIAIARALLRDPEIIILDEATSSLDNVSEKLFQDSIERISKSKTVITVAHRLSTIMNADKIYVINRGAKVEEGTHEELLARKGIYWQLYREEQKSDDSN